LEEFEASAFETVITDIKYEGYIKQAQSQMRQLEKMRAFEIPKDFAYESLQGLSREAVDRLKARLPKNLEEASRLEGVGPAAVSALAIYISKRYTHKDSCVAESAFV
jgi:tRNA uridine 5-carboxymethylaminomethyl modification enzyme